MIGAGAGAEVAQGRYVVGIAAGILAGLGLVLSLTRLTGRRLDRSSADSLARKPQRWALVSAGIVMPPVFLLSYSRIARHDVFGSLGVAAGVFLVVFTVQYFATPRD
jgi:hypothetical protein